MTCKCFTLSLRMLTFQYFCDVTLILGLSFFSSYVVNALSEDRILISQMMMIDRFSAKLQMHFRNLFILIANSRNMIDNLYFDHWQGLSMVLSKDQLDVRIDEPMDLDDNPAAAVIPSHKWLLEQLPFIPQFSAVKPQACAALRQVFWFYVSIQMYFFIWLFLIIWPSLSWSVYHFIRWSFIPSICSFIHLIICPLFLYHFNIFSLFKSPIKTLLINI